jgi:putative NIF3 family GTP cyclohydrolase 1 type 2
MLKEPAEASLFLKSVSHLLDNPSVSYAGPLDAEVRSVGLCGGSGSSLFEAALDAGVDAFVTGEVKHSVARLAEEAGVLVVDAGHFHTEYPVVPELASFLEGQGEGLGFQVDIFDAERPPLRPFEASGNG